MILNTIKELYRLQQYYYELSTGYSQALSLLHRHIFMRNSVQKTQIKFPQQIFLLYWQITIYILKKHMKVSKFNPQMNIPTSWMHDH